MVQGGLSAAGQADASEPPLLVDAMGTPAQANSLTKAQHVDQDDPSKSKAAQAAASATQTDEAADAPLKVDEVLGEDEADTVGKAEAPKARPRVQKPRQTPKKKAKSKPKRPSTRDFGF
jgi:hypothetical protein